MFFTAVERQSHWLNGDRFHPGRKRSEAPLYGKHGRDMGLRNNGTICLTEWTRGAIAEGHT